MKEGIRSLTRKSQKQTREDAAGEEIGKVGIKGGTT